MVAAVVEGMVQEAGKNSYVGLPTYTKTGIKQRQCTKYFKILPVRKYIRQHWRAAVLWIGISTDEISRCKPSPVKYVEHRWPLLDYGMNRNGCLKWMQRNNFPKPPKSACIYCPYQPDSRWQRVKRSTEWGRVVNFDLELNKRGEFLHPSRKPISEVDFSTEEERGQLNLFNNECEGMCGV